MIRAFTIAYDGITSQIKSEVKVSNGFYNWETQEKEAKIYTAIWDTGASSSAITQRVVNELQLDVISRGTTVTAAGPIETTVHSIHLWLPNSVVTNCFANCVDLGLLGVDLLIGMDVIVQGDFCISNFEGKTVMSFRIPSQEHIDFVKQCNPNRSSIRPCGSGKKYKRCCGK